MPQQSRTTLDLLWMKLADCCELELHLIYLYATTIWNYTRSTVNEVSRLLWIRTTLDLLICHNSLVLLEVCLRCHGWAWTTQPWAMERRLENKHQSNDVPLNKAGVEFSKKKVIPQPPHHGRIHPTMSYGEEAWLRDHVLLHATCSQALSLFV